MSTTTKVETDLIPYVEDRYRLDTERFLQPHLSGESTMIPQIQN